MSDTEKTEKITINLGVVDLGQIDLLVQEGFYSNRTDFIRTAIRDLLAVHRETIKQTTTRRSLVIGILSYNRKDLEDYKARGIQLEIKVTGMLVLAKDVTPELACDTIASVQVFGVFQASEEVRQALSNRVK